MKQKPTQPVAPAGWELYESKHVTFSHCWTCHDRVSTFFYRHFRKEEGAILQSEIKCPKCLWKSGNQE